MTQTLNITLVVNGQPYQSDVDPQEIYHEALEHAPPGIGKAYFLSSGSEAVEAALKLARQYHVERGDSQRRVIVARTFSKS